MRFQIILALGLFVAVACASPLIDKKKEVSSLRVIDIPADLFAEASENVEDVKEPQEAAAAADVAAPQPAKVEVPKEEKAVPEDEKTDAEVATAPVEGTKNEANETQDAERPNIFGFRLPTIVILRRPAIFDDPFSFFPFSISSLNRRPAFGGPRPTVPFDNRRDQEEDLPRPAEAAPSEQRPVSIGGGGSGMGDMMHGLRQQMDSLFSSLFAPNPGYFPNRQFFPRPFFPSSVPSDSTEDSDEFLDFGKLPDNYKNSTSKTKVVDGQVITVNKTVHKISGNNSNGFFHFSVVKIRPSESPATEEEHKPEEAANNIPPAAISGTEEEKKPEAEVTTIKADQEAEMSNPSLNEVDQEEKEEITKTKYETDPGLLEEPSASAPVPLPLTQEVLYDFVPVKSMPLIQTTKGKNDINRPHDLSSDLRVNNLMANAEAGRLRSLVDSDEIEIIEV